MEQSVIIYSVSPYFTNAIGMLITTTDRSFKTSPDWSGYEVEQSGTSFERKAGQKLMRTTTVSLLKKIT